MKIKFNFYRGAIFSVCLIFVMIALTEFSESFKTLLTNVFGHHWIAKAVLGLGLFVLFALSKKSNDKLEIYGWYSVIGGLAAIFILFALAYLL